MTQPENSFRAGVHKHLPPELHHEKMHNPYRGGTADDWYSGPKSDLWVEYKFEKLPARDETIVPIDLSELQKKWLAGRRAEGRNVHVIVGCAKGGVVFSNLEWLTPLTLKQFLKKILSRKDLAEWILHQTGAPP
jgi:hypothetical protein